MAISRIVTQDANGGSNTGSVAVVYPVSPTEGNLLLATAQGNGSDLAISGWTEAVGELVVSAFNKIFYKIAGASESATVTATSTGANIMRLSIYEYEGNATSGVLDVTASTPDAGSNTTSRSSGTTAVTAQADSLAFAALGLNGASGGAEAVTNSFTMPLSATRMITAEKILSATGTQETTFSWSSNRRAAGMIAVFKADAGGADVTVNLDLAVETDTAYDLTVENPISVTLDLATETDSALDLVVVFDDPVSVVLDLAEETDTAFEPTIENPISVTLDLAIESDTALDLSVENQEPITVDLDLAQETDTAHDLLLEYTVLLDLATEVDTAHDFQVSIEGSEVTVVLDIAIETDFAFDLLAALDDSVSVVLDQAIEVDTALEPTVDRELDVSVGLDLAQEVESAFDLSVGIDVLVILDLAIETDIAHVLQVILGGRLDFVTVLSGPEHKWQVDPLEHKWQVDPLEHKWQVDPARH